MRNRPELHLSNEDFEAYLVGGGFSEVADDHISNECIPESVVRRIVHNYNEDSDSPACVQALGLLSLLLAVAEWGVEGENLPADPAGKQWQSDTGEDSGKHLMSYAVGGVGISHADVGDLEEFLIWIANSGIVPSEHKQQLLDLTEKRYRKEGVLYDELRAAGRCFHPEKVDLLGEDFRHFDGPAGSKYCRDYENGSLDARDWLVFRTWVRKALRTREAQRYLLNLWFRDYWQHTLPQVPPGEGAVEEMLVNARIRNSAPRVARLAPQRVQRLPGTAGRVQRELDAYAEWRPKTARRRWRLMMRPVVLYRHFSHLDPLEGVGL